LDGDGKPDMLVANYYSNTISVLRNISSSGAIDASSFAPAVDFTTESNPSSVASADLDGDGKLEIIVGHRSSNTVSVWRNNAVAGDINAASFAPKVDFTISSGTFSVAISDIDSDGKPDIIAVNFDAGTISVLRNTTSPGNINSSSFADKVDYNTGPYPAFVAISDLDGDGKPDMAVTNYTSLSISVLHNTSTQGIIDLSSFAEKVNFATGDGPYSIAVGDLDGDGKPDLVVPNSNTGNLSVLRNVSVTGIIDASSFANEVEFNVGNHPVSISIGDLDGDGKPDLATANQYSSDISLLRNTSITGSIDGNSFAPSVNIATGAEPITIAIGDLDGDGVPEMVTSNFTSNNVSVLKISVPLPPVITSFNPSNGPVGTSLTITGYNFNEVSGNNIVFFGAVKAIVTSGNSTSLSVIVPVGATYQPISVLNNENGRTGYSASPFVTTFTNPFGTGIPADFYKPAVHFASGLAPHSIVFGDLDGDSKPDMVVANRYSSNIFIPQYFHNWNRRCFFFCCSS
jgi:FG-GAP-like repeat/IPT/TIG domain